METRACDGAVRLRACIIASCVALFVVHRRVAAHVLEDEALRCTRRLLHEARSLAVVALHNSFVVVQVAAGTLASSFNVLIRTKMEKIKSAVFWPG